MTPAVIYAAKSTRDEKGSIPTQLEQCRAKADELGCEGRQEWEFQDEDQSAYHGNRGGDLARAMTTCEQLAPCVLIVQHSDRLARGDAKEAKHLVEYALWSIKTGVRLVSLQDPEMLPEGELALLLACVGGMRNHQDSKRKAKTVADGMWRETVEKGYHHGRAPYGYRVVPREKTLVIVPWEASVVWRIFEEFAAGVSQRELCRRLNREGISAKHSVWSQGSLRKLLSNPVYIGKVTFRGQVYEGKHHEAIITEELWHKTQALMQANRRHRRSKVSTSKHLLADGMLTCPQCGSVMESAWRPQRGNGVTWEAYMCSRRRTHGLDACPQKPIKRQLIDIAIHDFVMQTAFDLDATEQAQTNWIDVQVAEAETLGEQATREAEKARAAITRIERDYIEGKITADQWGRLEAKLTEESDAAGAQADQLEQRHQALIAYRSQIDAKGALVYELAKLKATIIGEVHEGSREGIDAFRAALRRLFVKFEARYGKLPRMVQTSSGQLSGFPEPAEGSTIWQGIPPKAGDLVLYPHLRSDVLDLNAAHFPELLRTPLALRGSDYSTFSM